MQLRHDPSAGLLAAIVGACDDAVVGCDQNDRITVWNPAAAALFGYPASTALGQPVTLIVPASDADAHRAQITQAARAQAPLSLATRYRRRDGTILEVAAKLASVRDEQGVVSGYVTIIQDQTARLAPERLPRSPGHRFQLFFERIPGLTYIYEPATEAPDSGSLLLSQAFAELTGYPAQRGNGDDFVALVVHPDDRAIARSIAQHTVATDEPYRAEYRILDRNGQVHWVRDQANYVAGEGGEPPYWLGFMLDVTAQKQAEAALVASDVWFRTVFEDAPIGKVVVDPAWNVIRANRALCEFLGYTEAELIERSINAVTHPDDVELDRAIAERMLLAGIERYDREKRYVRKDGQVVWGHLYGSIVRDEAGAPSHFIVQIEDITERKAQEAELEATHQNMRDVLERVTDGFLAIDRGGRITFVNEAAMELVPVPLKAYEGQNFWDAFPETRGTPFDQAVSEALATGTTTTYEMFYPPFDSWYDGHVYPSSRGVSIFFRNVTEEHRAATAAADAFARLQQANHELAKANRELEQLSAAKSDFVSTISHEFRTPLTSIQGFSELLATEDLAPDETRAFIQTINQNAVRLARMVSDVLDLDRMEAGQSEVSFAPTDLNALVRDVLSSLEPTAPRHRLVTRLDPGLPVIEGDVGLLERVITNLVANALKYSPTGDTVTVSTSRRQGDIELMVADEGMGVPAEHRERIFSRYGRISRPEQHGIEGTGLGLPIARHILERHNGRIWVEPNDPQGSIFHVVLPVNQPAQPTPKPIRPRRRTAAAGPGTG